MPQRKQIKAREHDLDAFAERYETYSVIYGDPIEFMFCVMANKLPGVEDVEPSVRKAAADTLMSHRFPKIKAQEIINPNAPPINFTISMTQSTDPISINGRPQQKVLEIKSTRLPPAVDDLIGEKG